MKLLSQIQIYQNDWFNSTNANVWISKIHIIATATAATCETKTLQNTCINKFYDDSIYRYEMKDDINSIESTVHTTQKKNYLLRALFILDLRISDNTKLDISIKNIGIINFTMRQTPILK